MGVSNEQVVELMRPAMYWVTQMESEIRLVAKGVYRDFTNRTDRVFTYREQLIGVFGEEVVEQLVELSSRTFKEYEELVTMVFDTLEQKMNSEEGLHDELEDVMFWSGEIMYSLKRVRETVQLMGYEGDVEDAMYELGLEFLSTVAE